MILLSWRPLCSFNTPSSFPSLGFCTSFYIFLYWLSSWVSHIWLLLETEISPQRGHPNYNDYPVITYNLLFMAFQPPFHGIFWCFLLSLSIHSLSFSIRMQVLRRDLPVPKVSSVLGTHMTFHKYFWIDEYMNFGTSEAEKVLDIITTKQLKSMYHDNCF